MLTFDFSQQLIDDLRNATAYDVYTGAVDLDGSGFIDTGDTGQLDTVDVYDGLLDMDDDGFITGADTGTIFGYDVYTGALDIDGSGLVDGADNGVLVVYATASLVGGCVLPGQDPDTLQPCTPTTAGLRAAATADFEYHTVLQDFYSCPVPSGDQFLRSRG